MGEVDEGLVVVDRLDDVVGGGVALLELGVGVRSDPRVLALQVERVSRLQDHLAGLHGDVLHAPREHAGDADRAGRDGAAAGGSKLQAPRPGRDDLLQPLLIPPAQAGGADA